MLLFQSQQLFLVLLRCITTENILGPLIFSEHDTRPLKCIPSLAIDIVRKSYCIDIKMSNIKTRRILSLPKQLKTKDCQVLFHGAMFVGSSKNQIR